MKQEELHLPTGTRQNWRSDGPETSEIAGAEFLADTVKLGTLQRRALELVASNPDATAWELTELAGDRDPRTINRRLSELRRGKLADISGKRVCAITGKLAQTWRIK